MNVLQVTFIIPHGYRISVVRTTATNKVSPPKKKKNNNNNNNNNNNKTTTCKYFVFGAVVWFLWVKIRRAFEVCAESVRSFPSVILISRPTRTRPRGRQFRPRLTKTRPRSLSIDRAWTKSLAIQGQNTR